MSMNGPLYLTHGCSLSNLPLFVAEGAGLFADEGLQVEVPFFTDTSSTVEALMSGAAHLGTAAFIQAALDAYRVDPPVVVAGSGLMGIYLMSQPEIGSVLELRGKRIGSFRGDPMEVLLHDALLGSGLTMTDVRCDYYDKLDEAVSDFESRKIDALTIVEPYASRLRDHAQQLSDGTELWGNPFPDTVLVAARSFVETNPGVVRAVIRGMLRAEVMIKEDLIDTVRHAQRHFPGFTLGELTDAARNQPPCVDIRPLSSSFSACWESLASLKLVGTACQPRASVLSLGLLACEVDGNAPAA